jgi:hypothetical protein
MRKTTRVVRVFNEDRSIEPTEIIQPLPMSISISMLADVVEAMPLDVWVAMDEAVELIPMSISCCMAMSAAAICERSDQKNKRLV